MQIFNFKLEILILIVIRFRDPESGIDRIKIDIVITGKGKTL